MQRTFRTCLIIAGLLVPVIAACSGQQASTQQPQTTTAYPNGYYPQQTAYPTAQQYPTGTYQQPAATTPATTTASPFPFPIPTIPAGMIPSGLIPGWPAPTTT